jgi:transcriptional antiterminator RfaH
MSFWCCAQLVNNRTGLALHCLKLEGFETYAPRIRTVRVAHRRKIESHPLLFPSYVFVLIVAQWHLARWQPGVVRLILAGDATPAKVPDAIVAELRARETRGVIELPPAPGIRRGDPVRVLDGPFQGLSGLYAGSKPRQRVEVLLKLLGSAQRVQLAASAVEASV